jgi:type II secretory pathway component PulL
MVDLGPLRPVSDGWLVAQTRQGTELLHQDARFAERLLGLGLHGTEEVEVTAVRHPCTRDWFPLPEGTRIQAQDLDWLVSTWESVLTLEWEVRRAGWITGTDLDR